MTLPTLHRRWCGSCRRGETWPLGAWHVPLVTAQYEREQAALEAHRRERAARSSTRRAVAMAALRGHVGGA